MDLSIIIPAYNEEKRIEKTLESVVSYVEKQDFQSEIIVVNDGSKDKTSQVVEKFKNKVKLIDNKENKGKGAVVKQGMLQAQGKYRLFMDADNSTTIDHIEKVLPLFSKGYQIVIGTRDSRDIKEAKQAVPQPFFRRLLGSIGNIIIQVFAVPGIWDTQCGFKVFTDKIVNEIFPKMRIQRWGFDIEILFIAKVLGYRNKIGLVPVCWNNDAESKVGLKGYFQVLKELFQIRIYHLKGYYNNEKK